MTAPAITADGQNWITGGIKYVSVLAEKRWKRQNLTVSAAEGSITTGQLLAQAVRPDKTNFSTTFTTTPPGSPVVGTYYIVTATATGAWVGKEDQLATWDGSIWRYVTPYQGMIVYDIATNKLKTWNGTAWIIANDITIPDRLTRTELITNWGTISSSGWYRSVAGATGAPDALDDYSGIVTIEDDNRGWAIAAAYGSGDTTSTTTKTYRRDRAGGLWGPWYPWALSKAETDALYVAASTALIQVSVLDRDLTAPPGSPTVGAKYLVKTGATGIWATHDRQVAEWSGTVWNFTTPTDGTPIWVADEKVIIFHTDPADRSVGALLMADQDSIDRIVLMASRPLTPTFNAATSPTSITAYPTNVPATGTLQLYGSNNGGASFAVVASGTNLTTTLTYAFNVSTDWQFYSAVVDTAGNVGNRSEIARYTQASSTGSGGSGGPSNDGPDIGIF